MDFFPDLQAINEEFHNRENSGTKNERKNPFQSFKPNDTNPGLFSYPANLAMANTSTVTSALKAIYTIKVSDGRGRSDRHIGNKDKDQKFIFR